LAQVLVHERGTVELVPGPCMVLLLVRRWNLTAAIFLTAFCFGFAGSDPSYDDKLLSFTTWLKASGAEFPNLRLGQTSAGRRGVFATKHIHAGDIIMRLPYKLLFTRYILAEHVSVCESQTTFSGMGTNIQTAVALLFEREKGAASLWAPMIQVLPESFDTPMMWTDVDLELWKGSVLYPSVMKQRGVVKKLYERYSARCPEFGRRFTLESWFWAVEAVISRIFGPKSKLRGERAEHARYNVSTVLGSPQEDPELLSALVPLADMANHHEQANTTWGFNDQADAFEMKANTDIAEGYEIYDSYGRKDAMSMLEQYGFIPEELQDGNSYRAMLRLPLCVPPSLRATAGPGSAGAALGLKVLKIPELPLCCNASSASHDNDEACFAERIRMQDADGSLFLLLGQPSSGSEELYSSQLAKVLAHFRLLLVLAEESGGQVGGARLRVSTGASTRRGLLTCIASQVDLSAGWEADAPRTFAEWRTICTEQDCFPAPTTDFCVGRLCAQLLPVTADIEVGALRLLRALVAAHLAQSQWTAGDEAEDMEKSEASRASSLHRAMVRRYLLAERETMVWHTRLVEFATPLLVLDDKIALREEVCRRTSMSNTTLRRDSREFRGYVDTVVATLAFMPWPEDQGCSVVSTKYLLTKECLREELGRGVDDMISKFREEHSYEEVSDRDIEL